MDVVDEAAVSSVVDGEEVVVLFGAVGLGDGDPVHPQSKATSITSHRVSRMSAPVPGRRDHETPPTGFGFTCSGKNRPQ